MARRVSGRVTDKLTSEQLYERIVVHHPANEWAVFPQVRNAAGFGATHTMDAVAMNLWPTRGLAVHGFEIKVYRGDWLRELKAPAKAEGGSRYCDYWWIVAPADLVKPDELPAGWGLLVPRNKGLAVTQRAEKRVDVPPLDRSFVAALLKRASSPTVDALKLAEARGRADGVKAARAAVEQQMDRLTDELAALRTRQTDFERLTGIRFESWVGIENIAARAKIALKLDATLTGLAGVRGSLRTALAVLDEAVAAVAES